MLVYGSEKMRLIPQSLQLCGQVNIYVPPAPATGTGMTGTTHTSHTATGSATDRPAL